MCLLYKYWADDWWLMNLLTPDNGGGKPEMMLPDRNNRKLFLPGLSNVKLDAKHKRGTPSSFGQRL